MRQDSEAYFDKNYANAATPGHTEHFEYKAHYSKKLGMCFMRFEYKQLEPEWYEATDILDVYAGQRAYVARFLAYERGQGEVGNTCEVAGKKCTSWDEFKEAIKPYTED